MSAERRIVRDFDTCPPRPLSHFGLRARRPKRVGLPCGDQASPPSVVLRACTVGTRVEATVGRGGCRRAGLGLGVCFEGEDGAREELDLSD